MRSLTRLLRLASAVSFAVLISSPVLAQDKPIDCENINNTIESNFCADRDFKAADAKLNDLYKKVLAQISGTDLEKPYDRTSWEAAMREAQRAWVAFRDADCKGAVPMEWSGGTGTTAAVLGCMTEKTQTRIKELKERYEQE